MSTMIDLRECVRAVHASQSTQGIDDVLLNLILTDKVKMFDKFAIAKTLSTQLISNESPTRHTQQLYSQEVYRTLDMIGSTNGDH